MPTVIPLDISSFLTIKANSSSVSLSTVSLISGTISGYGTSSAPFILGSATIEPSRVPGTSMDLEVLGFMSPNSNTIGATFTLYDLTNAVSLGSVSTTSTVPTFLSLTGLAKPSATTTYELRVQLGSNATSTNRGVVQMARLRFY